MIAMRRWITAFLCIAMMMAGCVSLAQEDYTTRAQTVLEALLEGRCEEVAAQFDENMAAAVDAAALESVWSDVGVLMGGVTGVAASQEDAASRTAALLLNHERGQTMLVVVFDEQGRIAGLSIAPQQQAGQAAARELPDGVSAQLVTLFAGTQRALRGELLIPAHAGASAPYAVLVQGSGPSDMDETIGACKPLRDLAYDLAALGVGSLRFDKITYACPQWPVTTVEQEYLEPVMEALTVLKESVSADKVFLIGHSQGGMLAPYLVEACGFAGGAVLAGTPLALWEISYAQNLALIELMPEEQREALTMQVEAEREKALRLADMTEEEAAAETVFGVNALYQRHMAALDQAKLAEDSGKPFIFLWGEQDFQVESEAFGAWRERLGDDARFAYKTYPGLNHLFMPAGENESIAHAQAACQQPKTMDAQVAADIAAWIKRW